MIKETRLFFPLDVSSRVVAESLIDVVGSFYDVMKVGLELMNAIGQPEAIALAKRSGHKVFVDGKMYDIPNTVRKAAMATARHNIDYFNVMAEGGRDMMSAAKEGSVKQSNVMGFDAPKLIAVTIPTSQSFNDLLRKGMMPHQGMSSPISDTEKQSFMSHIVMMLAEDAVAAGVDCLLSSPLEAPEIIRRWPNMEVITPGIRNPDSKPDDQNRKMSPYEARMAGITNMVIGRLITEPPEGKSMVDMATKVRADIARAEFDLTAWIA